MSVPRFEVLLSIGSDVEPIVNVPRIVAALRARFADVRCSPVYEGPAVDEDGSEIAGRAPFRNLAARCRTDLPFRALREACHRIEEALGRRRSPDRFAPRAADIDVVFGDPQFLASADGLPPDALLTAAHVLVPAAAVWPDAVHPATGLTLVAHRETLSAVARSRLRNVGSAEGPS